MKQLAQIAAAWVAVIALMASLRFRKPKPIPVKIKVEK